MKRLLCIIADDEPPALSLLKRYVEKTPYLELAGVFDHGHDVLENLPADKPVLLFLDIQMPGLSGIEVTRRLPEHCRVVFTTAFEQFALEGYKVNALDYLLKPFDYEEFLAAAARGRQWFELVAHAEKTGDEEEGSLFVRADYNLVRILYSDILFIEGLKDYVRFHLKSTAKTIMSLMTMKSLEEKLPQTMFMRVHRSYIVQLNAIESVDQGKIVMGKYRIPVAQQHKEKFKNYLAGRS